MTGAKLLGDLGIILGALVGVADHQLHRGAGGAPFEHAREDLDLVGLLALRGVFVLTGFALIQPSLNHGLVNRNAGGATIDGRAKRGAVTFAPGGDPEQMTKAVEGHRGSLSLNVLAGLPDPTCRCNCAVPSDSRNARTDDTGAVPDVGFGA